jgi:hypothetical protein
VTVALTDRERNTADDAVLMAWNQVSNLEQA